MKINIDTNLLNYSDWDQYPDDGDTGYFSRSKIYVNNINTRVTATDPFNNQATVWDSYSINSGTTPYYRCGYFSDNILIDPTKKYRTSVWVRRLTNSENTFYFGFLNYDINYNLVTPKNKITGVVQASICYTTSGNINPWFNIGEWVLFVGHIWAYDTVPGGTNDTASGFYLNGLKTHNTTDFIFNSATTYINQRLYSPYLNPPFSEDSHWQYIYPRIDLVDGTEPSIQTLLSNEGNWRTINTGGTYINIEDNNLTQYNTWESGTTKPSNYQEIASSNVNLLLTTELDPYGNSGVCWNCIPINSALTTTYGFYPNIIDYDDTYDYRFSVWMKRTSGMSYNNYAFRVGFRIYDNNDPTYSYEYLKSVTSSASDPRLGTHINDENFNTYLPIGDWVFCNVILRKFGTSETTNSNDSGYWINGTKIGIGNSYCDVTPTLSGSTQLTVIVYMNNTIGDTEMLAIYPRLDKLDGTEPSIQTLLTNEGNWRKINDMKINIGDDWKNTI